MPATEYEGGSVALTFLGRSILSIRRNQVASMEGNHERELEDVELFLKHVADRFHDLSSSENNHNNKGLLSLPWLQNVLAIFLSCEAEFKAMLLLKHHPTRISKPPYDRLVSELLDRTIKALDICNAITIGIDSICQWQKQAKIAVSALGQTPLGEGQFRRAKRALTVLLTSLEEKDGNCRTTDGNRSFGKKCNFSTSATECSGAHLRSLSWGVPRTWSASKQVQAMAGNLVAPRSAEMNGLALPIYTMNMVLVLVMWILIAAVPCQDRGGLTMHLPLPPRLLACAAPMAILQEKIVEEWRKKEKKGAMGLMKELQRLENCAKELIELGDKTQFPIGPEQIKEIQMQANDLADTCRRLEEELIPFGQQVREVFHRIVTSRADILDCMGQTSRISTSVL